MVIISQGNHPFSSRTRKLSPVEPEVLIWKRIYRASDLNAIDSKRYASLNVRLSQEGYKKNEPLCGLERERPSLFKDLLTYFVTNLQYSEKDILSVLNLFREDYIKYFDLPYSNNFSPKIVNIDNYRK